MAGKFSIEAVFRAVDRMSGPIDRMTRGVEGFKKKLGGVEASMAKISGGLKAVGAAAIAAGAAVGVAGKNVIDVGAGFDQQMADLGAVSLMTRDQISDLEKQALALGRTTKFSATQVGQGMELMAKAGFTNAEIMSGISGVLAAAAADGGDLAETASHVSNVLKGMGLAASEAGRVADVLALASARTNSSIGTLAESMANTSATARQFKIPLEEVVAGVALLQDVGLDASVAGSAMNTMLTALAKPSKDVAAKMRKMGVTFQDAQGNMLPFTQVIQNLVKSAEKSGGNMEQVAFFADLVGLRGQKAAANLADLFKTGKVSSLTDELNAAAGAAEKMASLRMNTFKGDLLVLDATVEGLKIELFDMERGPLRELVQGVTQWIEANRGVIKSGIQEYVGWLRDNFEDIVKWAKRLAVAVGVFYSIKAAVAAVSLAVETYTLAVKGAEAAMWLGSHAAKAMAFTGHWLQVTGHIGRAALNASSLGTAVNGITSSLGQAGLLGAALAVGYAIGSWLDETYGLSDKISALIAQLTGVEDSLNAAGGRRNAPGLDGPQHLADGTIIKASGEFEAFGTRWQKHANGQLATLAGANRPGMSLTTESADAANRVLEGFRIQDPLRFDATTSRQVVSPQERTARTISETNTTSTSEIVIRDETGRAEVTKKPKAGAATLKVAKSGAL